MLNPPAIRVDGVSKCYQVYRDPKDRLKQAVYPRLQKALGLSLGTYFREFWALRSVSLAVGPRKTVGIIGRNGSGKSTLLQIICGTLTPTAGTVEVQGRVAALLELGSGFNPEFTGRENVYLNASILGLTREQTAERFTLIEQFADIGSFIDQPIKTYSSGMVVRLAFAVIAHVDADILIIDEALAVGDAIFTQKCMRFLRSFKERGTILFVSHDVGSVLSLCDEAIWLDSGSVRMNGEAREVAKEYARYCAQQAAGEAVEVQAVSKHDTPVAALQPAIDDQTRIAFFGNLMHSDGWATGAAEITSVVIADATGSEHSMYTGGETLELRIRAIAHSALHSPIIGFLFKDRTGQSLFGHNSYDSQRVSPVVAGQKMEAAFRFVLPLLPSGTYSVTVAIADGTVFDNVQHHWLHDAILVSVTSEHPRYGLVGIPVETRPLLPLDHDL